MREHTNIIIRQMLAEGELEEARKRSVKARVRLARRRMGRVTPLKLGLAAAGLAVGGALAGYGATRLVQRYRNGKDADDEVATTPDAPERDSPRDAPPVVPLSRATNENINSFLDYYLKVKGKRSSRVKAMMELKYVIGSAGNDLLDLEENKKKLTTRLRPSELKAFIKEINSASHYVGPTGNKIILPAINRISYEHLSIHEITGRVRDYFRKNRHKLLSARSSSYTYGLVNLWWAPFYQRGSIIANFYANHAGRQIDSVVIAFRSVNPPALVHHTVKPGRSHTATDKPGKRGEDPGILLHKDAEPSGEGFAHFKLVPEPYIRSWLNRTISPRYSLWGDSSRLDR